MSANLDVSSLNLSIDVGQLGKFLQGVVGTLKTTEDKLTSMEQNMTKNNEATEAKAVEREKGLKETIEAQAKTITQLTEKLATLEAVGGPARLKEFEEKMLTLSDRTAQTEAGNKNVDKALADLRVQLATMEHTTHDSNDNSKKAQDESKATAALIAGLEARVVSAEATVKKMTEDLIAAEDELSTRYEKIRNELTESLSRVAHDQANFLSKQELQQLPMEQYMKDSASLVQSLVGSAQRTIASAKFDVQRRKAVENIMLAWQQQTGQSQKRLGATRAIKRIMNKKVEQAHNQWKWQTKLDSVVQGFYIAIDEKVPTPEQILANTGFPDRVADLERRVSSHTDNIATTIQLGDLEKSMLAHVSDQVAALTSAFDSARADDASENQTKFVEAFDSLAGLRRDLNALKSFADATGARLDNGEFATTRELQKLMTDVLLLWNAMKQLDAGKAEKKEFEQLAVELTNKSTIATHMQPTAKAVKEANVLPSAGGQLGHVPPDLEEIGATVMSNAQKVAAVQGMLAALSEFVEELVLKISGMRGIEASKLPVFPQTLIRTGGGFRELQGSDVALSSESHTQIAAPAADSAESMDRFLRYARSLVGQSSDYARSKSGRPTRPASGRRELPAELRLDGNTFRR